jgi:hypothetical protein
VTDTLQDKGRWSQTKLIICFSFWANVFYCGYSLYKFPNAIPDIPYGWLTLVLGGTIIKQAAVTTENVKGVTPNVDSPDTKRVVEE